MRGYMLRKKLLNAFPEPPKGFDDKIDEALSCLGFECKARIKPRWRPAGIAAAAAAVLIILSFCLLMVRPVLAADIPVVSDIVCALSPVKTPEAEMRDSIADTAQRVLSGFFSGSLENIGRRFKSGEDWALNDDTLLAAYYLQFESATLTLLSDGETPDVTGIRVTDVQASQKAFRYTADVRYELTLGGKAVKTEAVRLELRETSDGLRIVAMSMDSADFEDYRQSVMQYQSVNQGAVLSGEIATYNAWLTAQAVAEHDAKEAALQRGDVLSEEEQIEDIAAELRYQYYLARMTCAMPDLSALIERNEDTELFFLALDLQIRMAKGGMYSKPPAVEKGYAEILALEKDGDIIEAKVYVKTIIYGSVGEEVGLTLRPTDNGNIIIAYENCSYDGIDASLAWMAAQYISDGCTRMEAYDKAYREVLERVDWVSAAIREYMEQGLSEEDASAKAAMDWYNTQSPG